MPVASPEKLTRQEVAEFKPVRKELQTIVVQYAETMKALGREGVRPEVWKRYEERRDTLQERFDSIYEGLTESQRRLFLKVLARSEESVGDTPNESLAAYRKLGGAFVSLERRQPREQSEKGQQRIESNEVIRSAEDRYLQLYQTLDTLPDDDPQKRLFVGRLRKQRKLEREESKIGIVAGTVAEELGAIDGRFEAAFAKTLFDQDESRGILHALDGANEPKDVDVIMRGLKERIRTLKGLLRLHKKEKGEVAALRIGAAVKFIESLGDLRKKELEKKGAPEKAPLRDTGS